MACSGACRSISSPISASRSAARRPRSSACRPICSCRRVSTPVPSFRLWRSSVTVEELTTAVARYIGEERTKNAFESFAADPRRLASRRVRMPISSFCGMRSICLHRRSALRRLGSCCRCCLRKRTVSTKAALKLLDDANAAIHYNREILQTALEHVSEGDRGVRQGHAARLLEPAIRRNPRSAAGNHRYRHAARRILAAPRRARHLRSRQCR